MDAMDTQSPTYSDDELTASLVEHLASLDRDDSYRVERVLKLSDVETTELVYFEGSGGGSLGPFVRKRIDASVQIGGAYERLFAAQRAGRRFEHLPRIVDCRRVGDELDVVMEYVEGETLEALVGRLGATPDYARGLYPVLCEAVGELHAGFAAAGEPGVPVIHRDLKPSNIIVSGVRYAADAGMTFSSLVIIDLGIARVWRDGADADTVKFGTRPYAPPEQYGFGQTSVRSDVYALGALLFFCLTGLTLSRVRICASNARRATSPWRWLMSFAWPWRSIRPSALEVPRRSDTLRARHTGCVCLSLARIARRRLQWRRLLRKWRRLSGGGPRKSLRWLLAARACFHGSRNPLGVYGTA